MHNCILIIKKNWYKIITFCWCTAIRNTLHVKDEAIFCLSVVVFYRIAVIEYKFSLKNWWELCFNKKVRTELTILWIYTQCITILVHAMQHCPKKRSIYIISVHIPFLNKSWNFVLKRFWPSETYSVHVHLWIPTGHKAEYQPQGKEKGQQHQARLHFKSRLKVKLGTHVYWKASDIFHAFVYW